MQFLLFLKDMVQLTLAPGQGWSEVEDTPRKVDVLLEKGAYPLLALVAATAFLNGLYGPETFSVATQLKIAIVQFLSLFLGVMIGRAAFETLLPRLTDDGRVDTERASTVVIYSISFLSLIQIVANVSPVHLTMLRFMPVFIVLLLWHARTYLNIDRFKNGYYIVTGIATVIALPMLIEFVLGLIV